MGLIYAEEVGHYWKTGSSSPSHWIDRAKRQIEEVGGKVLVQAEGYGDNTGRTAFMLAFEMDGERFKLVWPVLDSKTDNVAAARRQAATMLYHDVKAKAMTARVLGFKAAFFSYFVLPSGQTAAEASTPELQDAFPKLLSG